MKRQFSEKFLQQALKNLPSPEESGPKTKEGKFKVSRNRQSHGLFTDNFMACKKENCFYYSICALTSIIPIEEFNELEVNGICIPEYTLYRQVTENLSKEYDVSDPEINRLVHEYGMAMVKSRRVENLHVLVPDIGFTHDAHYQNLYRIGMKLKRKLHKVTKRLLDIKYGNDNDKK